MPKNVRLGIIGTGAVGTVHADAHQTVGEADIVAKHLRPQDAVCVGVYTKDHPDSLAENLRLLTDALKARRGG